MKTLAEITYRDSMIDTKATWTLDEATGLHKVSGGGMVLETKDVLEARREFRRHVKAATRYILDPKVDQA